MYHDLTCGPLLPCRYQLGSLNVEGWVVKRNSFSHLRGALTFQDGHGQAQEEQAFLVLVYLPDFRWVHEALRLGRFEEKGVPSISNS